MKSNVTTTLDFPGDSAGVPRRIFLKHFVGGAAAAAVLPHGLVGEASRAWTRLKAESVIPSSDVVGDEVFWKLVKEQFMLRRGLIMLNAANLCPSPYPVQQAVFEWTRDMDRDPSSINRRKFSQLRERSREAVAEYVGADPDEIALTRNTSEGNNIVISGLTFRPGDEVIIWDENHPTANIAWDVRAERYGFTVKRVRIPARFEGTADLIRPFTQAMTSRTRILCFSHLSNISGVALPAKEICRLARERGVLSHIDGAQTFGSQVVDLHDLGCDFYTGSAHKWFMGPREVGLLYVRKARIADLWPSIVGVGYSPAIEGTATKFETLGQRDDARIAAMATAAEFHLAIGPARIAKRIQALAALLKRALRERIPDIRFYTPTGPEHSGGVVVFTVGGIDLQDALSVLYRDHHIGAAVFGGDLAGVRLCPHIYNTREEVERAAAAVAALT
jgi:selenocysteine lyase/cysteine desulfurase